MKQRARVITLALLSVACWGALPASAQSANTIAFPDDIHAVQSANGEPGWIKFIVLTSDPGTVIFQNSVLYPFHYDFAVSQIPQFQGMTPEQFDQVTLFEQGQQAILGAVILPPLVGWQHVYQEYGIQLIRHDPYPRAEVVSLFNLVKSNVLASPAVQAFYFPTFEQQASAEAEEAYFNFHGIELSSTARWARGNGCYSHGWTIGELKYFPSDQIDAAFLNGDLLPTDVLLTDGVPAEIPFLAGVITLSPSSPASHTAILAQNFNIPFGYLVLPDDIQLAQSLVGDTIALRVEETGGEGCGVRLIDVEQQLDQATIDEILDLKTPPPVQIQPMQAYGAYSASTDLLGPADVPHFGGKASNYGLLRQSIPANSPVATAFSFDLWNVFMGQAMPGGGTLADTIDAMLAGYTYPPDVQALDTTLDDIRDLIKDDGETVFPAAAAAAIVATLQDPQYDFDSQKKIRFRSSTNAEDGEVFTGAGLYDSFSGCLADDTDADGTGPSHCDPGENNERGVFRAVRKVFASFYNLNAYLERLRHGIDESDVGMALLVHHSFPDEIELANGVALLSEKTSPYFRRELRLLTQAGSNSVTNPEPGEIVEDVFFQGSQASYPIVLQHSNLVQLGDTVMEWDQDYQDLRNLLVAAAGAWKTATGDSTFFVEMEFKKTAPDGDLIVKQIRSVPNQLGGGNVTPFLINEPMQSCVYQTEHFGVFDLHRLKSRWTFETRNMWMTPENVQDGLFGDVTLEYQEVCQLYQQAGPMSAWPQWAHDYFIDTSTSTWRFPYLQNPRNYTLEVINVDTQVPETTSPILTLEDLGSSGCFNVDVDYDSPVPDFDFLDQPVTTTHDDVRICPCFEPSIGDQLQQVLIQDAGVTVSTQFYWPPAPEGATGGYTAPLKRWVETTIWGLTTPPLVLHGDYSQTYSPAHHNFGGKFAFEPALEPGISQAQLDQLEALGVRVILADMAGTIDYYDAALWTDSCLGCSGFDADGDGFCTGDPTFDCDDTRGDVWSKPGEVPGLLFSSGDTLTWDEPPFPGAVSPYYDTLRTTDPGDFGPGAVCVEWDDGSDRTATDTAPISPGVVHHFLVRAQNDCPDGEGTLGADSDGSERQGASCP